MTDSSNSPEFLTFEEVAEIDQALLSSREKFSARVALYSLRSLKRVAQEYGVAIEQLNAEQIMAWVAQDPSLHVEGFDPEFKGFFSQLVISSLRPLKQIALEAGVAIESLTVPQVVVWFEKEAKQRLDGEPTFLG